MSWALACDLPRGTFLYYLKILLLVKPYNLRAMSIQIKGVGLLPQKRYCLSLTQVSAEGGYGVSLYWCVNQYFTLSPMNHGGHVLKSAIPSHD